MKKFIKTTLLIIFLLAICGWLFFKDDIIHYFSPYLKVTAFQVGAYSSLKEAEDFKKKYPSAMIYKDEEIYRVIISILDKENAIDNMKEYFDDNNINYYLKTIMVSKTFYNELTEYDDIICLASTNAYDEINNQILNKFNEIEGNNEL